MSEEELRIGVYVCHCGGNISDYVDVKKVVEAIKGEPGVVVAKDVMFACSDSSQNEIINDVKEHNLNRVVVASCSPKLHELTFRETVKRAGLNPYLYYHANIREHVSWAHTDTREGATEKAIRHVRAAIAYVRNAKPLEPIRQKTMHAVLVIGGGIAGLRAALDLSRTGLNVYLVERSPFLGGRTPQLYRVYPDGRRGADIVKDLVSELIKRDNVAIYTNAEIKSFSGYIGNFEVEVEIKPRYIKVPYDEIKEKIKELPDEIPDEFNYGLTKRKVIYYPYEGAFPRIPVLDLDHCSDVETIKELLGDAVDLEQKPETVKLKVGAVIVATGFDPYEPKEGEFGYGRQGVVTLPQLHRLMDLGNGELKLNGREIRDVAFVYCVGSRQKKSSEEEEVNEYCSRYCCNAAMYISSLLMEQGIRTYHIFRDIRTYGRHERMYDEVSRKGGIFIKYNEDEPLEIEEEGDKLLLKVKDLLTAGEHLEIPVDLVVLVTGMVPRKTPELDELLRISRGRDRFYVEVHPKLRPVETAIGGIFIAGACQAPRDICETLSSASAAASKAATVTLRDVIELEPFKAEVDPNICDLSKKCIEICPYEAIEIKNYEGIGEKAWVNKAKCMGCGACVAVCPTEAIQLNGLTNEQIRAMIEAAGKEVVI